ncbi:MAG TPA: hypothetical protein VIV11_15945 [Kofleriaceae bacterium]
MKRALTLTLLLFAVGARAESPRKTKPKQLVNEASKAFDAAIAHEDAGRHDQALDEYKRSFELMPHAHTMFNIANLEARHVMHTRAVAAYEHYLVLAPSAPDRKTVEATITALLTTPATIPLEPLAEKVKGNTLEESKPVKPDVSDAYVISDGAIVRKPKASAPTTVVLAHGYHSLDFVRAITFYAQDIDVRGLNNVDRKKVDGGRARQDGNVLFRLTDPAEYLEVRFRGERIDTAALLAAPPGTYRVVLSDRRHECPPITIVVPKNENQTLYVHITAAELKKLPMSATSPPRCRKLAITQHVLTFD